MLFELTNDQRKYLGLAIVQDTWELVEFNKMYLYYDGDIIRKKILVDETSYYEEELCERTSENRTILLPKTAKGKPKKLNFTATQSFSPFGVYFRFSARGYVTIGNYTTQTTYFSEKLEEGKSIQYIKTWLDFWIADSSMKDIQDIEAFRKSERKHCKFKEGDYFAFKIGRRSWGFGRILVDVSKRRKDAEFKKSKNYGLNQLMGKPLIVKVYHKISDTLDIHLDELSSCQALPSQAIMDNCFYYGEYIIIGYKELQKDDYDMLISYSKSIDGKDQDTVYLQYGFIYKEANISEFNKYLSAQPDSTSLCEENPYRNEGVGFSLDITALRECMEESSNRKFWEQGGYCTRFDLRNPANHPVKKDIFNFFGLDADKTYEENLGITQ